MKATNQQVLAIAQSFQLAIDDRIKAQAKGGVAMLGADAVKAAAFPAFNEAVEAETASGWEFSPAQLAAAWEAVLKINESAYRQGFFRRNPDLKPADSATRAKGLALSYCES